MRIVNRTVITLKPKQPYIDWANSLDDSPQIKQGRLPNLAAYLVDGKDDFPGNMSDVVEWYFAEIFEQELLAWHMDESDWPSNRDLATFLEWFEVEVHPVIMDLGRERIATELYDGY